MGEVADVTVLRFVENSVVPICFFMYEEPGSRNSLKVVRFPLQMSHTYLSRPCRKCDELFQVGLQTLNEFCSHLAAIDTTPGTVCGFQHTLYPDTEWLQLVVEAKSIDGCPFKLCNELCSRFIVIDPSSGDTNTFRKLQHNVCDW
jgi:hypothetical protein